MEVTKKILKRREMEYNFYVFRLSMRFRVFSIYFYLARVLSSFLFLFVVEDCFGNRPFYSCVLSYLAMNASEAGGDLALIQTFLLFSFKCQLVSIRKTCMIYTTKTVRSISKQGHLQSCCHSETRSEHISVNR